MAGWMRAKHLSKCFFPSIGAKGMPLLPVEVALRRFRPCI